jgi:hypothetical protein
VIPGFTNAGISAPGPHRSAIIYHGSLWPYGRGAGVGRALGNGLDRGDAVGLGVAVGVGVDVDIGVVVGVDVAVAIGVGVDVDVALGVDVAVGVEVAVAVGVGVCVGVGLGDAVGVGPCTSKEPLSIRSFTTRSKPGPRWSKKGGGVKFGSPESTAGLPGNSAWVKVGPPLSCSGPSIGSVLI